MYRRTALAACLALAALAAPSSAAANEAPTCSDLEYTTAQDTPLTLFGGCSDPDGPAPLTYSLVDHPDSGSLPQVNPNGTATYLPNPGFTGTDSLRFTATDGAGATAAPATATITVVPDDGSANRAPTCPDVAVFVAKNTSIPLFGRCIDPDGDTLTYEPPAQPGKGTLTFPTLDSAIYTPGPDYVGPDSFTYRARDVHNLFAAPGTVSIQVVEPGAGSFASGAAPSASEPAVATVTTTQPGPVVIQAGPALAAPPGDYTFLDRQFNIGAPDGNPLTLTFTLDSSIVPAGQDESTITVFRDGVAVADCTAPLVPDPCVAERTLLGDGDVRLVVTSTHASRWNFGVQPIPPKRGKGCGDKNHAHAREGSCRKPAK
ncbi:MAG TPA: Ig-like domain-containing protein [Thermoleophilaceae bacterium]|jgi:hypothetical protein